MGLDTTHGCWCGAYSSFASFRKDLARQIGISNLNSMVGFGGNIPWTPYINHDLYPLLNHSDCDGEISPSDAGLIIRGLDAILADVDINKLFEYDVVDFVHLVKRFRDGAQLAFESNEEISFH